MSDLFGNHIVGFPTRRLKSMYLKDFELRFVVSVKVQPYSGALLFFL